MSFSDDWFKLGAHEPVPNLQGFRKSFLGRFFIEEKPLPLPQKYRTSRWKQLQASHGPESFVVLFQASREKNCCGVEWEERKDGRVGQMTVEDWLDAEDWSCAENWLCAKNWFHVYSPSPILYPINTLIYLAQPHPFVMSLQYFYPWDNWKKKSKWHLMDGTDMLFDAF